MASHVMFSQLSNTIRDTKHEIKIKHFRKYAGVPLQ